MEVTLNTVELFKTRAFNRAVHDDILTNGEVVKMAQKCDYMTLYWFPAFHEVVVSEWTLESKETPGTSYTNDHVPSLYSNFALIASLAKEVAFSLTESKCAVANTLGMTDDRLEANTIAQMLHPFRIHCFACTRILFGIGFIDAIA